MQLALDVVSGIQPVQNLRILSAIEKKLGGAERLAWAKDVVGHGLRALELEVKRNKEGNPTGCKYMVCDEVTVAEACLIPQLYNARRFNSTCGRLIWHGIMV